MSERALVISVDGLAPRHITPSTMPNLCALARTGGSCFTARTVFPSITVPAHASMFCGVTPEVHGLVDNTPLPPAGDARSFLAAARDAGRTTACVLCWLPLDHLVEAKAATYRVVIDSGYDPGDDDRVTMETIDILRRHRPDVTLAYLVSTDLAGHASGWGSADYLAAARRVDELLAELVDVAGPDTAIVVTTDHGGVGRSHADPVIDTLETFVVVRSRRVQPGSRWPAATILDIAPTVVDLIGVEPDRHWSGTTLLGHERPIVDHLLDLVATMADHTYGERVDMLQHSLQTAACARADGADDDLVLAALLHDVGHVIGSHVIGGNVLGEAGSWGLPDHAEVGARYLQQWLPSGVVEPIRLHVDAKRYLVATDPNYVGQLSEASIESLREQGGAFDEVEVAAFLTKPHAAAAVALRRHDDDGKVTGLDVQALDHYRESLHAAIGNAPGEGVSISPSWARDACRCSECRHQGNGQHLIDITDLSGWRVERVDRQPDVMVVDLVRDEDGARHRCLIPEPPSTSALPTTRWNSSHIAIVVERTSHAGSDAGSEESLERFARDLSEYGIAMVAGLATESGTVLDFVSWVGFVRTTNYGDLFDVRPDPNPTNLAFTSVGLPLHTDNPYRDPVPTVQFLHCLRASAGGGASLFSDGFNGAEILRAEHPDDFAVLTTTQVEFRFGDDTVDLRASVPLIQLDADGTVVRVTVNHRSMEPLDPARDPERFYDAYARFAGILADPANTIELTLRPGELVGFDNRRVLHGRRGYDADPDRHLQGCYLDIDAIRSIAERSATAARRTNV